MQRIWNKNFYDHKNNGRVFPPIPISLNFSCPSSLSPYFKIQLKLIDFSFISQDDGFQSLKSYFWAPLYILDYVITWHYMLLHFLRSVDIIKKKVKSYHWNQTEGVWKVFSWYAEFIILKKSQDQTLKMEGIVKFSRLLN